MRELRVSLSSSDRMEGSGARQAADVKPILKSLSTKGLDLSRRHQAFAQLLEPCGTRREPQEHLRAGVSPLPPVQTLRVNTPNLVN